MTYTGLIRACDEAGLWQDAVEVFNHMRTVCAPNITTFNVMIGMYGRNKRFSAAMALYEGIVKGVFGKSKLYRKEPTLSPDEFTFDAVLSACVRSERWEEFKSLYRVARQHGFNLNNQRHTWMVTALSRADKVMKNMPSGVQKRSSSWKCSSSNCYHGGLPWVLRCLILIPSACFSG